MNHETVVNALEILISIRDDIKSGSDDIDRTVGICWHVHNRGGDYHVLEYYFKKMKLDKHYPVETLITGDAENSWKLYQRNNDKYNPYSQAGKIRRRLLDNLIRYLYNRIDNLERKENN